MNTRIFVLGAAAGAVIAAIAFVALRSEPSIFVDDKPDAAMNGETLTPPTKALPAQAANGAEELPPPQSPEPDGSLQQSDARKFSRILTPEQVEAKWHAEARDESWAATSEMAVGELSGPTAASKRTRVAVSRMSSDSLPSRDIRGRLGIPSIAECRPTGGNRQYATRISGARTCLGGRGISISDERPGQITMSAYLQRIEPPAASNQ